MAKYRRKPLIVEAFRFTRESILAEGDGEKMPDWAVKKTVIVAPKETDAKTEFLICRTLSGDITAMQGDYIVKGAKGEVFPFEADIFPEIYELVEEEGKEPKIEKPQLPDNPKDGQIASWVFVDGKWMEVVDG